MSRASDPPERLVCATCGRVAVADGAALLAWGRGTEGGHTVWTCDTCSREHLRAIEGKLDSAWW